MNSPVEITPEKNFIPVVKDTVHSKKRGAKDQRKDLKTKKEIKIQDTIVPIGEYPSYALCRKENKPLSHFLRQAF